MLKPKFTGKSIKYLKKINIENGKVISEESELAEILWNFFDNIVKNVNIE